MVSNRVADKGLENGTFFVAVIVPASLMTGVSWELPVASNRRALSNTPSGIAVTRPFQLDCGFNDDCSRTSERPEA